MGHENVYFANGNYERRSSKLADENASAELYLKEPTVIYGFYLLTARLLDNIVRFKKLKNDKKL